MNVKIAFSFFNGLKLSYICFAGSLVLVFISALFIQVPDKELQEEQTHLAVRSIGDELLKSDADFSTPVPPVERKTSEALRLNFDAPIAIDPDRLAALSLKYLHAGIVGKAIVKVLKSDSGEVVYGFEIDNFSKTEIPCLGRVLPKAQYYIEVSFYPDPRVMLVHSNTRAFGTAGASIVFVVLGFLFVRNSKTSQGIQKEICWNGIRLDLDHSQVIANNHSIQLTSKESQILTILLEHTGHLVSRDFFLQHIWEKEGVITDRSLDMYISRLRKKLKVLPHIEIANQHGKGYYLKSTNDS